MLNWVLYLEIYLAVGFVVCSAFIGTHLFVNRHKSTVFDYMRRSTNREWTHFLCDFFEDFFIPAVALEYGAVKNTRPGVPARKYSVDIFSVPAPSSPPTALDGIVRPPA